MLNSDELGEKGQAHFKEICADAKLVCNQSDRDRTGWDFIVEFPFETAIGAFAPLENRITPLSCHIQVKTLLEKNDTFQMRLSSAERLAKELKPSFVYVFKVNEELQFTSAYLIHILNEPLGKILKRLRKEDAAGSAAPNKKTISMSSKCYGIALAPTGKDLSDALVSACGVDLYAYTTKKVEQLAKLGFEERPCELKMTLLADNTDHLVDVFLGRKKIQAENLSSVQKRFGIPLTMPELSEGKATISIQPSPFDTCTIIVRSDPLSTPAVFKGKVFLPNIPNLPKKLFKIFIETDLFSLTFSKDSWNIATGSNFSVQTPSSWAAYWRLLVHGFHL